MAPEGLTTDTTSLAILGVAGLALVVVVSIRVGVSMAKATRRRPLPDQEDGP